MTFTLQKVGCVFFRQDRKKEFLLFLALRSCVLGEGTPFIFLFFPHCLHSDTRTVPKEGGRNKRKSNLFSRAVELAKHALRTLHIPPLSLATPYFPGELREERRKERRRIEISFGNPPVSSLSNRLRHESGGTRNQKSDFFIHICCHNFRILLNLFLLFNRVTLLFYGEVF